MTVPQSNQSFPDRCFAYGVEAYQVGQEAGKEGLVQSQLASRVYFMGAAFGYGAQACFHVATTLMKVAQYAQSQLDEGRKQEVSECFQKVGGLARKVFVALSGVLYPAWSGAAQRGVNEAGRQAPVRA